MRILVFSVILALFGLVALGYNAFSSNLTSLKRLNQENLVWTSDQMKFELITLIHELERLTIPGSEASPKSVNDRFDILWSRIAQSEQGSVGKRLQDYDSNGEILAPLFATLKDLETDFVTIRADDLATISKLIDRLTTFEKPVYGFDRMVFLGEEALVADIRRQLWRSALFTALLTLAAFILTVGALFWVSRENTANKRMAAHNLELANEAEIANQAKSQFLNMMSHELRTPMNGVLGMISLAKQSGMPTPQLRLIEQAERSGQQMIAMLSDILDYSALQDNQMEVEKRPFSPSTLARSVEELFGSVAKREGIDFDVSVDASCPLRVEGDFSRLRQVVAHFSSYIVEMAGTDNVHLKFSHAKDQLEVKIQFAYRPNGSDSEEWNPDILLGKLANDPKQFASDALGPAVARGILDKMGGKVQLEQAPNKRISVLIFAPAKAMDDGELVVFIDTNSESLHTICRVGLAGVNVIIADESYAGQVHVVLFESGGQNETARREILAKRFPKAQFVSLGAANNPLDFSGQINLPVDIKALRTTVFDGLSA